MRWGENNTREFVKLYLKHECLWNSDDPNYRVRPAREQAIVELAQDFKNVTGVDSHPSEIKTKIRNVRSTYSQQLNKIIKHSQNPDSLYQPSLVWFNLMDDRFKNITHKNIVARQDPAYDVSMEESNKYWEIEDHSDRVSLDNESSGHDTSVSVKKERNSNMSRRKKKKANYREESPHYASEENADSTLHLESAEALQLEDEFDIYGKHVAAQLRRLDLNTALRLQMEINSMITGARLAEIEDSGLN